MALNVVNKMNLPVLVGLHVKKNGKLPSNETITEVVKKCKKKLARYNFSMCISEIVEKTIDEVSQLNLHFGYKVNLWDIEEPLSHTAWITDPNKKTVNPIKVLGTRKNYSDLMFLKFSEKMVNKGTTILGGCCETKPSHIKAISKLK